MVSWICKQHKNIRTQKVIRCLEISQASQMGQQNLVNFPCPLQVLLVINIDQQKNDFEKPEIKINYTIFKQTFPGMSFFVEIKWLIKWY